MSTTNIPHWLEERPLGELSKDGEGAPVVDISSGDILQMGAPAEWFAGTLLASWCETPLSNNSLSVSLEAPWGAGKTSFAHLVKSSLFSRIQEEGRPVWVDFNAWQSSSMGIGAWAAVAYRVGQALYERVHAQACKLHRENGKTLPLGSPRRRGETVQLNTEPLSDERLHWLEVARIIAEAKEIEGPDWHPCLKLYVDAPTKITGRGGGWGAAGTEVAQGLAGIVGALATAAAAGPVGVPSLVAAAATAIDTGKKAGEARDKAKDGIKRLEGPAWGVDTREFVEHLNTLCAVLVPHALKWRLVVLLDDVSRVPSGELQSILDALSYLRELRSAVVLMTIDNTALARMEEELPPYFRGRSERFASKVVHTRYRLPPVDLALLGRFGDRFLTDLGLSAAFEAGSEQNPIRRLMLGGVETPRDMKRALAWLWGRLVSDGPLLKRCQEESSGRKVTEVLALLVDIHLFVEGLLSADDLDTRARVARHVFLRFSRQPWDGQSWSDRGALRSFSEQEAELVAWTRCLRLAQFAGMKPEPNRSEVAENVWRRWCQDLHFGLCHVWNPNSISPEDLEGIVEKERVADILTLLDPLSIKLVELLWVLNISAAARSIWLAANDEPPSTFGQVLDRWHDADALAQTVMSQRVSPRMQAAALILLRVLHPEAEQELDPGDKMLIKVLDKVAPEGGDNLLKETLDLARAMHEQ